MTKRTSLASHGLLVLGMVIVFLVTGHGHRTRTSPGWIQGVGLVMMLAGAIGSTPGRPIVRAAGGFFAAFGAAIVSMGLSMVLWPAIGVALIVAAAVTGLFVSRLRQGNEEPGDGTR